MRNARRWSGVAGALAALVLAACGGGDRGESGGKAGEAPAEGDGGQAVRGGTVVIAEPGDMETPMPLFWTGNVDSDLVDVMYMSLLRGDWRDGRLAFRTSGQSPMALAWHHEYTGADSTAIRFRMKSGLKWSDGQPITARDVVWTFDMIRNPAVGSPRLPDVELIDSVRAENDTTVVFHFARRYPDMLFHAAFNIAPRHAYEGTPPAQLATHPSITQPAGRMVVSGPFTLAARQANSQITLARNPHFSVPPHLDRIVIRVIPDLTVRLTELRTGKVDIVHGINAFEQVGNLRRQAPFLRFAREQARFVEYLGWNPRTVEAFADREVRHALSLAVDVDEIIRSLDMGDFVTRAAGPVSPIFTELADTARFRPLRPDPARARQMLEARGWRDSDGDGIREKGGKPLRFTLETNSGNQRRADVAQIVQRQLRAVGVDMQVRTLEFNTFNERLMEKKFEAALGSWGVQLTPDLSVSWMPDVPFNVASFRDPEAERLLVQAKEQPTDELARPLWQAAAERIVQAQPYTWLYYYDIVSGVNPRVRGMDVDSYGLYQNTWEWWIPAQYQAGPQTAVR